MLGRNSGGGDGVLGIINGSAAAVHGQNTGSGSAVGVLGECAAGTGVSGSTDTGTGVLGLSTGKGIGVVGSSSTGLGVSGGSDSSDGVGGSPRARPPLG